MPAYNPGGNAIVSNGVYTGDNTANRAIPHLQPGRPCLIFVSDDSGGVSLNWIHGAKAAIFWAGDHTEAPIYYVVTMPDATNFYVGNGTSYVHSGNMSARVYRWVAFG